MIIIINITKIHDNKLLINIFNNIRSMYPLQHGKNQTTTMTSASVRNILLR